MTELPKSPHTTAPQSFVSSSYASQGTTGRRPADALPPAGLTATLTDLSFMVTRVHAIRGRDGVPRDLDERLAAVITDLESLIHDLLHYTRLTPDTAATLPAAAGSSGASRIGTRPIAEAAFSAWLTSDDMPDMWQIDAPDQPQTSLTAMLGITQVNSRSVRHTRG